MEISDKTTDEMQAAMDSALRGDQVALNTLLMRFEDRFRLLTRKMLRGFPALKRWEETDDVLQNAMLRLHKSVRDARPDSPRQFVGLAATQIRRTLLDLSRHHFGKRGQGKNHQTAGGGRAADDPGGAIESVQKSDEPISLADWSAFHLAVENLPTDECEVFQLVWYTGLGQQEVADLLGVNRRTVVRRLQSARLQLTHLLAESP